MKNFQEGDSTAQKNKSQAKQHETQLSDYYEVVKRDLCYLNFDIAHLYRYFRITPETLLFCDLEIGFVA